MALKKQLKLKNDAKKPLLIICFIFLVFIIFLGLYFEKRAFLHSLGYSDKAVSTIIKKVKWSYVEEIGKNQMLNAAFESNDYLEKNLEAYTKIKYQKHKDIVKNVNLLLEKGYKVKEVSLILSRGSNDDVSAFAKRDKVKYLDEFFSIPYSKLAFYDRYLAYQELENEDPEFTVLYVNMDFDKEDYVDPQIISKFDEYTLVNKHRKLDEAYEPNKLKKFDDEYVKVEGEVFGHASLVKAFYQMAEAASKEGISLMINSGYRSYQDQEEIANTYLKAYGQSYVDNYVSKPGHSEHQTGMSIDVASKTVNTFVESPEYEWMMDNAYLYGFILRYPKSKEEITGYKCEAWHYRYVGKEIASYIKKHNITYDEYYVMFLDK